MKAKTKVLICVLSGMERTSWLNPKLALNLVAMSHDPRFEVQIETILKRPVDHARNTCVVMARDRTMDFLFMVDNDQHFSDFNVLDVLMHGIHKPIIGLPAMQGFPTAVSENGDLFIPNVRTLDNPEKDGSQFFTVKQVGTGAMFVNRRVWEKIPGPWFKSCHKENELHEPEDLGEDFYFCDLARAHGFKIWIHNRMIPHLKSCEITQVGMQIQGLKQLASHAAQINAAASAAPIRWNVQA